MTSSHGIGIVGGSCLRCCVTSIRERGRGSLSVSRPQCSLSLPGVARSRRNPYVRSDVISRYHHGVAVKCSGMCGRNVFARRKCGRIAPIILLHAAAQRSYAAELDDSVPARYCPFSLGLGDPDSEITNGCNRAQISSIIHWRARFVKSKRLELRLDSNSHVPYHCRVSCHVYRAFDERRMFKNRLDALTPITISRNNGAISRVTGYAYARQRFVGSAHQRNSDFANCSFRVSADAD